MECQCEIIQLKVSWRYYFVLGYLKHE
jgi:hypothetical protein